MKKLKDFLDFIKENSEDITRISSGRAQDDSRFIRGEGISVYPVNEMAYTRGDFSKKVENLTYQIAENTILICAAYEQGRTKQFEYWCKELFNKFVRVLSNDVIKKKNSYADRSAILKQNFFTLKEIHLPDRIKRICVAAQDKEQDEADRRTSAGNKSYPITVEFLQTLIDRYLKILQFCIDFISNSEMASAADFIVKIKEIIDSQLN